MNNSTRTYPQISTFCNFAKSVLGESGDMSPISVLDKDNGASSISEICKHSNSLSEPRIKVLNSIINLVIALRQKINPNSGALLTDFPDKKNGQMSQDDKNLMSQFHEFEKANKTGNDDDVEGNPFIDLAKLIHHFNLVGLKDLFDSEHENHKSKIPKKISLTKSLHEIKISTIVLISKQEKIRKYISELYVLGEVPLRSIFFVLSLMMSFRGFNELLQMPEVAELTGEVFSGKQSESLRLATSLIGSSALSLGILDIKYKINNAISNLGSVKDGIKEAFSKNPKGMILACLLAVSGTSTSLTGIESLLSEKNEDEIKFALVDKKVKSVLGSSQNPIDNEANNSLNDYRNVITDAANSSIARAIQIPEDEISGNASSNDSRKGPRYWGKYYIVNGDYVPGEKDVVRSFRKNSFSRSIDNKLRHSDIQLDKSFEQKINLIISQFSGSLDIHASNVLKSLSEIKKLLKRDNSLLVDNSIDFKDKQITKRLYEISKLIENSHEELLKFKSKLEEVSGKYENLISNIDKSGASLSKYEIKLLGDIHELKGFGDLRDELISISNSTEYKNSNSYLGKVIFLVLALMINYLDFILFTGAIARRGKRDKNSIEPNLEKLEEFDNETIQLLKLFFSKNDIQLILGDLMISDTCIKDAYLDAIKVFDNSSKKEGIGNLANTIILGIKRMFSFSKITDVRKINDKIAALNKLTNNKEFFLGFLNQMYPSIDIENGIGKETFAHYFSQINNTGNLDDTLDPESGKKNMIITNMILFRIDSILKSKRLNVDTLKTLLNTSLPHLQNNEIKQLLEFQERFPIESKGVGIDKNEINAEFIEIEKHDLSLFGISYIDPKQILFDIKYNVEFLNELIATVKTEEEKKTKFLSRVLDLTFKLNKLLSEAQTIEMQSIDKLKTYINEINEKLKGLEEIKKETNRFIFLLRKSTVFNSPDQLLLTQLEDKIKNIDTVINLYNGKELYRMLDNVHNNPNLINEKLIEKVFKLNQEIETSILAFKLSQS